LSLVSGSLSGESFWDLSTETKETRGKGRRLGHFSPVRFTVHWLYGMRWFLPTSSHLGAKVRASYN
jgi:hypothetical protein